MEHTDRMQSAAEAVAALKEKWRAKRIAYRLAHPDEVPTIDPDDVLKDCPGCGGNGWVAFDGSLERCTLCQPAKHYPKLEDFQVPFAYDRVAKGEMEHALMVARLVIETAGPPWLVLYGPNGTGKTMLAAIILAARQKLKESGQVWRAEELVGWLRETQGSLDHLPPEERQTLGVRLDHIRRLRWLVLDELGKERRTEFAMEQLESIINRRYVDKSGLVVTTNFDPRGLDSPFSPAVRSRFGDAALCEVVSLDKVPDYRPTARTR